MLVERSVLQPIFAGTQSAGLDKSENPEAPSFQQQFAETVEAVVSGGRAPHQPIEQEIGDALPEIETPPGQDEGQVAAETEGAESAETAAPIVAGELALGAPDEPPAPGLPEAELPTAPAGEAAERTGVRPAHAEYAQRKTSMLQELQKSDGALAELVIGSPEQKPEGDVAADSETVPAANPEAVPVAGLPIAAIAGPEIVTLAAQEILPATEPEVVAIAEPEMAARADPEFAPVADPEFVPAAEVEAAVMAEPQMAVQEKGHETPAVLQPPAEVDVKVRTVQLAADVETEPAPVVEAEFAATVAPEAAVEPATGLPQQESAPRIALPASGDRAMGRAENTAARGDRAGSVRPAQQAGSPAADQTINDSLGDRQIQAEVVSIQVVDAGGVPDAERRDNAVAMRAGPVALGPDLPPAPARLPVAEQRSQRSDPHEQVERIVRVMRASISRGGSRVSLRLSPPSLGPLRIQMQIRNGELVARFETQTEAARSWVSSQLGSLREALAVQNIRLVGESVEARGEAGPANEQAGQQGDFSAGTQAGSRQPQEQRAGGHQLRTEADVPQWAETQADDNRVNVVA